MPPRSPAAARTTASPDRARRAARTTSPMSATPTATRSAPTAKRRNDRVAPSTLVCPLRLANRGERHRIPLGKVVPPASRTAQRRERMRVRFFGTRGSIATPGPSTLRYGGNTSCVEVRSNADTLIIVDMGTGAAVLGRELAARGGPLRGHILISPTHWDHIQGLPFFPPLLAPGNEWDIYAPRGFGRTLRDTLAGQMQDTYFPVSLEQLGATIRYHDLVEGHLRIGDVEVGSRYLNHGALTLGYRLEADGVAVVYACDHEPHSRLLATGAGDISGEDRRHAEFLAGADLVVHDAQYLASEYSQKCGWGHSTVEYALAVARSAGVKQLALTHHDPRRDDAAIDDLVQSLHSEALHTAAPHVFAAAEGQEMELSATNVTAAPKASFPAQAALAP